MDGEGRERVWEVEHSEVMVYEEAMPLTLPGLRRLLSSVERPEDLQKFEETNLDAADWCFTQQKDIRKESTSFSFWQLPEIVCGQFIQYILHYA